MTAEIDDRDRTTSVTRTRPAISIDPLPLNVLRLAFLGLLLYCAVILLYPFSSIVLWSAALTVSLYPIYEWIAARLNGRKRLAAAFTTVLTLLVLTLPALWIAITLAESVRTIYERIDFASIAVPAPPEWIKTWPLIGDDLYQFWASAINNIGELIVKLGPQLKSVASEFLRISASAGLGTVNFLVAIVVMGCLFPAAPSIVDYVRAFARKLDPVRGETFVQLTGATIRAVARGVVGISALQAIAAGIGFTAGGIPQASLLTFAVLIFGIVQIGSAIVIIPVIVWSWTFLPTGSAVAFSMYMLLVSAMDNVLKPFLMGRGLQAPMLAILIGVVGGALSFGLSGVFLGPIILSVVWTLFIAWISEPEVA
jgi:predicted PurR-regulated permease PerM